jgi:hypothetical protein
MSKAYLITIAFLFLISLALIFNVPKAIAGEKPAGIYQPSALMLVESKARHSIIADKKRFRITTQTIIIGSNGSEITIGKLLVPCKAKVQYQPATYGDPKALKIVVQSVLSGASANWSTPLPE